MHHSYNNMAREQSQRLRDCTAGKVRWYSPLQEPFYVAGLGWFISEQKYRRLPVLADGVVPEAVDRLANHTAGGQIRFRTDSSQFVVRVRLTGKAHLPHMASSGQCGVDCYVGENGALRFVSTAQFEVTQDEYESTLYIGWKREMRSVVLNLPLYQGVEEIWIGLEEEALVLPPAAYQSNQKVIFYGTSVTQGGCASRPGMLHTNMLSRHIPLEFLNLGFSGSGRGEPEVIELIAGIKNPGCIILDYEGNCKSTELFRQTLPESIAICRARHPSVPILISSRMKYAREAERKELRNTRLERKELEQELVRKLRQEGDFHVYFFDGSDLLGQYYQECTVDGAHPTDLGYWHLAKGYEPVLRALLL
ncbi:hypothetical protein E6C60_1209 [Paenibacillus algicola]|uniref:Uncharacterized protein n=1 Tax=Paenibacillus algicola TaxID=2565926 RepID=A0A4P8XHB9_9BACL|nr:SGNH/GDSL hydrolase family protein [Paenibacillus algicola]QCT01927.1 hypothetical protein E6C60_1209 [Paenibacillus algicola]